MFRHRRIHWNFILALLSCVCLFGIDTMAMALEQKAAPRAGEAITAAYTVGVNSTAQYVQADDYCGAGLQV